MNITFKKTAAILLSLVLATVLLSVNISAADKVQIKRPVSLTVSVSYEGNGFEGVTYRLYKVADFSEDGSFTLTEAFKDCPVVPNPDKSDINTAEITAEYIEQNSIAWDDTAKTENSGQLTFPSDGKSLFPGIYLLLSDSITENGCTYKTSPLLISLPGYDEASDSFLYDLTSIAKVAVTDNTGMPNTSEISEISAENTQNTHGKLAQTGLLRWPVPVLVTLGTVCIMFGLYFEKRKDK